MHHGVVHLCRHLRIIEIRDIHSLICVIILIRTIAAEAGRVSEILMHDRVFFVVFAEAALLVGSADEVVLLNLEIIYLPLVHFFQHLVLLF